MQISLLEARFAPMNIGGKQPKAAYMQGSLQKQTADTQVEERVPKGTPDSVTLYPPIPPQIRVPSKAIPIDSKSMQPTASELNLLEQEAAADYRDLCMYTRIVNGIAERRATDTTDPQQDTLHLDASLNNIIMTRHTPVSGGAASYGPEGQLAVQQSQDYYTMHNMDDYWLERTENIRIDSFEEANEDSIFDLEL